MAAQKGRSVLIRRDGAAIGGLRQKSLGINGAPPADVSDSDSDGWRELLAGAGLKSVSISGSGVLKASASEKAVLADIMADLPQPYEFFLPAIGTFAGSFICTQYNPGGSHEGEVQFSMSWESAGQVTFTAVP